MLFLFRKYQKIIFALVAVTVISSFVFFGAYQVLVPSKKVESKVLFTTLEKEPVTQTEFSALKTFLSYESIPEIKSAPFGNFLNEDLLTQEFLSQEIGFLLLDRYRELFEQQLQEKDQHEKEFMAYVHPSNPMITAQQVWKFLSPQVPELLEQTQRLSTLEKQGFEAKTKLYLAGKQCPGYMLARFLRYFEQQYNVEKPDPWLAKEQIPMFGYRNLEDWFGSHYLDFLTRLVFEVASLAKKKGYQVTLDEARSDLLVKAEKTFEETKESLPKMIRNPSDFYYTQLRLFQIPEELFLNVWTKVLSFKKFVDDLSAAVCLDHFVAEQVNTYAYQGYAVEKIMMPKELCFRNGRQLQLFETYLSFAAELKEHPLALPKAFLPIEEVVEKAPFLVARPCEVSYRMLNKRTLMSKIPLTDLWKWQSSDEGFAKLVESCSFLNGLESSEDRLAVIDQLEAKDRNKVNEIASFALIDQNPSLIEQGLQEARSETKRFFLHDQIALPFPGILDKEAFWMALESNETLSNYSQNDLNYYCFESIDLQDKQLLPFEEVIRTKILDPYLLDLTDLKASIVEYAKEHVNHNGLLDETVSEDMIAGYRFARLLAENEESDLWPFERQCEDLFRQTTDAMTFNALQATEIGGYTPLFNSLTQGVHCYHLLDTKSEEDLGLLDPLKQALSAEAKQRLYLEMASKIKEQGPWIPLM